MIRYIILKSALPEILTGMRIGIGFGWTTLVAAEMVAAQAGLGFMVLNAAEFLVTDVVIMGIVVIGIIAYLFDMLMRYLERQAGPLEREVNPQQSPAPVYRGAIRHPFFRLRRGRPRPRRATLPEKSAL